MTSLASINEELRTIVAPNAPRATSFEFFVPGIPTPWARAGGGKTVVRFTPNKQRSAMGDIKLFCQRAMAGSAPIAEKPVSLQAWAFYPWPASWSAKKRAATVWKMSRPDLDNVTIKIVADALNGVAWIDDGQIAQAMLTKQYSDKPGLFVRVEALE
jgi:Holliday junction resolvase RusA-like endonuclease